MSIPKPPFHSATEELLYNIYLKLQSGTGLSAMDINTLSKLNAILTDADLMGAEDITNAINGLIGNVPVVANTLEKLYGIIQGLTFLKREDIDSLAELNTILSNANLVRAEDLTNAFNSLNLNQRSVYFYLLPQLQGRDRFVLRGQISSLTEDFTNELSGVKYKTRLDVSDTWEIHDSLNSLQAWINGFTSGNEITGTKYWIKCLPVYKQGKDDEAINVFRYTVI